MGGVAVDPVGTARRNHADFRHRLAFRYHSSVPGGVRAGIPNLHRAGMRAQIKPVSGLIFHVHIKRILHRPGGMIFRVVQRGKTHPVGFDLWALGHIKTHRSEDRLNALHRPRNRVQAADTALTARQGHIQGLGLQLDLQLGIGQRLAAGG